jgi:hypothetical protein
MSKFNAFRSSGRVDQRGVFNFEDEFGRDPIRDRYANTTLATRDSESRVRLAASEIDLAKASLEASLRPAKVASDLFTQLNSASTAKAELESKARTQAQAIKLRDRLGQANDYDSLTALRADPELSEAFADQAIEAQYNAKMNGLRARGIATLQNRLPKAINTAEVDGLVNEFSWLAGDKEAQTLINTFTPLAQRRESAMKGLVEAGAQQMPVTSTGEFDVDRAERALSGTYTSSDINALQRREANIAKRLADVELMDPDGEEATQLRAQMSSVTDQLNSAASQQERSSILARGELERLGVGQKGWQAGFIYGDQPEEQPQQAAAPTPESSKPVANQPETTPTPTPTPASETEKPVDTDKLNQDRERAQADVETLSEEQRRLYKKGYIYSPDKEQRGLYGRVAETLDAAKTERRQAEAGLRRARLKEINARLKQVGAFPADAQLREEVAALTEEKRNLTGADVEL